MIFSDANLPLALRLAPSRVHEAYGPCASVFAVAQALHASGTVTWVQPEHVHHKLVPDAMPIGLAERSLVVRTSNETDLLWAVEETLRSSAIAMVVAEPTKPLSLTAGRRLQLAAEAGGTLGLMLIREGAGSNAAETRWHCRALADSTLHQWDLIKNKKGTCGSRRVSFDVATHSVRLVSEAAE